MERQFEQTAEQAAAFQRIWTETASKLFQTAFTTTGNSPPPEILRQIRSGIFQALAQSWDEFMRSPQFLENMRQWMENAISFRKLSNDFLARVRNDVQAPSRDDIDTVMLTIRHMEKRLLDRADELSKEISALQAHIRGKKAEPKPPPSQPARARNRSRRKAAA